MSKIHVSRADSLTIIQVDTKELFAMHIKPYSWVFHVKNANSAVGACFCRTPLQSCPVLQHALKDKNLDAELRIEYCNKSRAVYDDADSVYHLYFTFIPTINPSGLQQKLTNICDKCVAIQIPWDNSEKPNKVVSECIKESAQHKK